MCLKFLVTDLAIAICIHLRHNLHPNLILFTTTSAKAAFQLIHADAAITIDIEDAEGSLEVFILEQDLLLEGSSQKLGEVNLAIVVRIRLRHDLHDIRLIKLESTGHISHVLLELFERDVPIGVGVPLDEHLTQISKFLPAR